MPFLEILQGTLTRILRTCYRWDGFGADARPAKPFGYFIRSMLRAGDTSAVGIGLLFQQVQEQGLLILFSTKYSVAKQYRPLVDWGFTSTLMGLDQDGAREFLDLRAWWRKRTRSAFFEEDA